jgi:hypothetical protein
MLQQQQMQMQQRLQMQQQLQMQQRQQQQNQQQMRFNLQLPQSAAPSSLPSSQAPQAPGRVVPPRVVPAAPPVPAELTPEGDEVWDLAACAAFKDAFDRRLAEAAAAEEEGGLTAERSRELQRELEHNITDMDPADLDGKEPDYLPSAWWPEGEEVPKTALSEWRKKICDKFHTLLVEEIADGGDSMTIMRRLIYGTGWSRTRTRTPS